MTSKILGWRFMIKKSVNIEKDLEVRIKKEVSTPENVDDTSIDDIEETGLEIHVDAEKTVQQRLSRKPWKMEQRRK
jgi:hypothetical protein